MNDAACRNLTIEALRMLDDAGADASQAIATLSIALASVIATQAGDARTIAQWAERCGRQIAILARGELLQ
jgi:hypothetical protein